MWIFLAENISRLDRVAAAPRLVAQDGLLVPGPIVMSGKEQGSSLLNFEQKLDFRKESRKRTRMLSFLHG